MTGTAPPGDGPEKGPDEKELAEYHRWSCDVLLGQFDGQVQRRRSLDAKAAQIIGAVAAVVLWRLSSNEDPPRAILGWGLWIVTYGGQIVAASVACLYGFLALRIVSATYPDERALTVGDDPKYATLPVVHRVIAFRDHLLKTLALTKPETDRKAARIVIAEVWAIVSIGLGVLAGVVATIKRFTG